MRQFLFGLCVAGLAWWIWTGWGSDAAGPTGSGASAGAGSPPIAPPAADANGGAPAATLDLGALGNGTPREAAGQKPLAAGASGSIEPDFAAAFAQLCERIRSGDADARAQGFRVVERDDLPAGMRAELRRVLGGEAVPSADPLLGGEDFATAFARLGSNNAFLHSAEGRRLGKAAVRIATALDDAAALEAMTRLIDLCMRGSIAKADREAQAFVDEAYAQLKPCADRVLCDPANLTGARSYTIQRGDSLAAVASRFRREKIAIDEHSLAILNRIHNPNAIREGQRIKVPTDPIHAVVEKRSFLLAVYVGDRILRLYWVGLGAAGKTPVAEFSITEKLKDPDWYAPDGGVWRAGDPKNILGRYFIKFAHPSYTGFGAHGTPMPDTIGTESSMGCIRMYDDDIAELFRLLPRGAKVVVRDSR